MKRPRGIDRREFLALGTSIAGGVLVTWAGVGCTTGDAILATNPQTFDALLAMRADGVAIVRVPVPEIGQGVRTSLAMLVAEELGVSWSDVRVEQADTAADMGPNPSAGGSFSVRSHWMPFRQLGAAAREAICSAAAMHMGVESAQCVLDGDRVRVRDSRRSVRLHEILGAAATLVPTDRSIVRLTAPEDFRILGKPAAGVDVPAIVAGTREYGIDVARPGMSYAVLLRPPAYGATVRSIDDAAARAIAGVTAVELVPPFGAVGRPYAGGGVAVVATSTWAAMRGRDALRVTWDEGTGTPVSTASLERQARAALARGGRVFAEAGALSAAPGRATTAEYFVPLLAHMPMEPLCCTAEVREGACEVWAPTQVPLAARTLVARRLEIEESAVRLHVTAIGGGFGRRLSQDFVVDAVELARRVTGPVQLLWTREDDIKSGFFRPLSAHRIHATIDGDRRITSWLHRQAGTSRYASRPGADPAQSEFHSAAYPGSLVPAHRLEYHLVDALVNRGPLRAPGHNALAFVVESFLDELAVAAGVSPLELRRTLLRGQPPRPYDEEEQFDPERMLAVLESAAARAGTLGNISPGVGRGIAAWYTFGTYCAHVVEAVVDVTTGATRVAQVWSSIDCGFAVDPDGVRAQVEGGVIDGLSAALCGGITIERGRVLQSNFHDHRLLRHDESPRIDVYIMPRQDPPYGAGEPPYPPTLPALANAIFAACGARVRTLPLTPERVREALADAASAAPGVSPRP